MSTKKSSGSKKPRGNAYVRKLTNQIEALNKQNDHLRAYYAQESREHRAEMARLLAWYRPRLSLLQDQIRDEKERTAAWARQTDASQAQAAADQHRLNILLNELANLFEWKDRSFLHAMLHVGNAVHTLQMELSNERELRHRAEAQVKK